MKAKNGRYFFKNDEEFEEWAMNPTPRVHMPDSKTRVPYFEWEHTDAYNRAVELGILFVIEDENSKIMKHGCISSHTASLYIQNLDLLTWNAL